VAATKTPPSSWIALIVLAFLTIAFGLAFQVKNTAVREATEGGETVSQDDSLNGRLAAERAAQAELQRNRAASAAQRRLLDAAGQDLVRHRTTYSLDQLISATATASRDRETILGTEVPSKLSPWRMTADLVAARTAGAQTLLSSVTADDAGRFAPLENAIEKRRTDMNTVLTDINAQDQRFKADQETLNGQMAALDKEKEEVERIGRDDKGRRQTRINQLEDDIRRLLELDLSFVSEILPCGTILEVAERGDRCIIDLARRDRIVPGMLFLVFTYDKGRFLEKGMVEVIRTTGTLSECRVTGLIDPRHQPLARGDRIGNPVYNPSKPPVFMFAGEFSEYNKADLAQFVRATGGTVVDRLQPGVDFLVVRGDLNDRSDKERALAREYQILAITERQLLRFVRPAFAPIK
jgi:hypothetical protein